MLFLLDANVLIVAERDYYPLDQVPEFWEWLLYQGQHNRIKIPLEIVDEMLTGSKQLTKDPLLDWLKSPTTLSYLQLDEEVDIDLVRAAISQGYAPDLSDTELQTAGRDPFLLAYAMRQPHDRIVVTNESSKPKAQRANRQLPDVCAQFNIGVCNLFHVNRVLGFSTRWKPS